MLTSLKLAPLTIAAATAISLVGCSQSNLSANDSPASGSATAATETATESVEVASAGASGTPIQYFAKKGIAIRGADPVAYFTDSAFVQGSSEFSHKWNGVTWQFASAENRDAFAADPDAFAPQYGGFCAWAVSQGYTADIDPEAWKIVDGKLYLNYNQSIQKKWSKDIPGNIAKADQNWPSVLSEG